MAKKVGLLDSTTKRRMNEFAQRDPTHNSSRPRLVDNRLEAISTGLMTCGKGVDSLVETGRDTLQESKTIETFMENINRP